MQLHYAKGEGAAATSGTAIRRVGPDAENSAAGRIASPSPSTLAQAEVTENDGQMGTSCLDKVVLMRDPQASGS